jgi:Zinc-binding dehydrogenase
VEPNRAQLIALAKLVDGGQLRVVIDSTFTLAEAAAAFERSLASGKHGKVVIEWPMTRTRHIERPSRSDQAPGGELGGNHAMVTPDQMYAMPSQQEGQLDDAEHDYQTAYQLVRTVAVNGGRVWPIASLSDCPPHRPTVDGMEEVRGSSPLSSTHVMSRVMSDR